jgi:hypothetical protein
MSNAYKSERGRTFNFNDHVCVEMLMGVPDDKRTGRLVQVRKGVGSFGSDLLFIRCRDGSLRTFENVMVRHVSDKDFEHAFYISNGQTPPVIPEQPVSESDAEDVPYTIGEDWPETGFIIEHPKQPKSGHQSFSMVITQGTPTP